MAAAVATWLTTRRQHLVYAHAPMVLPARFPLNGPAMSRLPTLADVEAPVTGCSDTPAARRCSRRRRSTRKPAGVSCSSSRLCSAPGRSSSAAPTTGWRSSTRRRASRGVVAYSSGNHAQGVAAAAQLLGVPATIVMPRDAPGIKLDNTRALGASIVEYDRERESREEIAARIAAERGAVVVPAFDDPDIVAGQGTVGLEIAEQCAELGVTPMTSSCPAAAAASLRASRSRSRPDPRPRTSGRRSRSGSTIIGARLRRAGVCATIG